MMELGNMFFGHSHGKFSIPRGIGFELELQRLLGAAKLNGYGYPLETPPNSKIFEVHPYCWCEKEDCTQCGTGEQYNFLYKPEGISIRWYKYPFRDAYSNVSLTLEEFRSVIDHCIESLRWP